MTQRRIDLGFLYNFQSHDSDFIIITEFPPVIIPKLWIQCCRMTLASFVVFNPYVLLANRESCLNEIFNYSVILIHPIICLITLCTQLSASSPPPPPRYTFTFQVAQPECSLASEFTFFTVMWWNVKCCPIYSDTHEEIIR